MIKAVIFDLDGLLIDSEIISYKIYQELLHEYGYSFSRDEYAKNYSGKTEVNNITTIIDRYRLPITIEDCLKIVYQIENKYLEYGVELKEGANELLTYLKVNHYKTAIASSSIEKRALMILKQHNLLSVFDVFVFGHEVELGKPSPDIFLKACSKLSVLPENCLVLEDSEAGIQAGYSANIPVLCIPDMKIPEDSYINKTCAVLKSLTEVIEYLKYNR